MADSKSSSGVDNGCGWGCGFALAVLFALTLFGSCARDITYNIERGRQDAITDGVKERQRMEKE